MLVQLNIEVANMTTGENINK